VVSRALVLLALGLVLGLGLAGWATRFLEGFLFEVDPLDPRFFVTVGVGLIAFGAVACVVPARRASSVDPLRILRQER
jgi:ABC-type lipoprotein release transport system permease subunit